MRFRRMIFDSLAAFTFAKYDFPGRSVLFYMVLATLMVPFQITMLPIYVTVAKLGLINSYWGVILPGTASAFGIFLIRQFMQSIPNELLDAARIDGCSELGIFLARDATRSSKNFDSSRLEVRVAAVGAGIASTSAKCLRFASGSSGIALRTSSIILSLITSGRRSGSGK